jgi:hypothetical protein
MNRARLSSAERDFRSKLAQLAHDNWLLRGTLSVRTRKCGKPSCHCAKGELHASLYLVQSHDGKPRQLCIPKPWEPRVRQAVNDYRQLQRLIEEVSELEWKRMREKKLPERREPPPPSDSLRREGV